MVRGRPFPNVTMPELAEAIRCHRNELQGEILQRIEPIAEPAAAAHPEYAAGTRAAISAALDYAVAILESAEEHPPPVPAAVLAHARLAARLGIGLGTVLRRYIAGFSLLSEAAIRSVAVDDANRNRLLSAFSLHLDYLLARIGEDYALQRESLHRSPRSRRAQEIALLLAGVSGQSVEVSHDWETWHVGLVAVGSDAREALLSLGSATLPGRLLLEETDRQVWAWVSGRDRPRPDRLVSRLAPWGDKEIVLGVGEPAFGLNGWRRSHQQAAAALLMARRSGAAVAHYSEVGVVASILTDDLLVSSLRERYLTPLGTGGRGEVLRKTLRGYLATECNVSSTAAALGVSRRTVRNRLLRVEERAQLRIGECLAELDLAMRIADLRLA